MSTRKTEEHHLPGNDVARERRRQETTSPRNDVAKKRRRQGTPPPSAATRPECAAQPSYAVVTNRAIPPIRNNRPRNCATTPGVSRQIRPDAHHGSTRDPWPKHPSTTPADLRPTAPARPPSCRLSAPPIRQKSHPRPVKRDFRWTEHMPPPTSNRETRRYIYNRALKTHRAKFTKNGLYLRVLRAWFP